MRLYGAGSKNVASHHGNFPMIHAAVTLKDFLPASSELPVYLPLLFRKKTVPFAALPVPNVAIMSFTTSFTLVEVPTSLLGVPGPQKYAPQWPLGLVLEALRHDSTSFWGQA